jgi:hypothetical protein
VSAPGVLIVTNEKDVGADYVVRELGRRDVSVFRLNTERFASWRLALEPGVRWLVARNGRELHSAACAGVWWRRPEPSPRPPGIGAAEWEAVTMQAHALLRGMQHVPGPVWLSPPSAIRAAEDKALQLVLAADLGFDVPSTTWTNDIAAATARLAEHDGTGIVKSVATAYWEDEQASSFVFAHPVDVSGLPAGDRLGPAPLAFQQRIAPKRDVRVTVVGQAAFAAVTDDASRAAPDWRLTDDATWTPYALPNQVQRRCIALVERMGLKFGGIDLLVDPDNRHWFCELNPNGEWGWLQSIGLPIAEAIAEELAP